MSFFTQLLENTPQFFAWRASVPLGQLLPTLPRDYFTSRNDLPFKPTTERHLANAWWCAEVSMLAYHEPASVSQLSSAVTMDGWQIQTFGDNMATYAVLLRSNVAAILAFRGTRVSGFRNLEALFTQPAINLTDLSSDFDFAPKPFPAGGMVHDGFGQAFNEFWKVHRQEIIAAIGGRTLFVTGHSLGAALATIAAQIIPGVRALYTFGSPRVGNAGFCDLFRARNLPVYRFVNGLDLVTTAPPQGTLGFSHVGTVLHLANDRMEIDQEEHGLVDVLADSKTLPIAILRNAVLNAFTNRLLQPSSVLLPKDALADHAPIFYVEKLRKLASR
jgi:hypothetical protein